MINLITEIIQKFGSRPAVSHAEKHAQLFIRDKCAEFTDNVKFMEFKEYLNARFGKLKYYCAIFFISLLLYYFNQPVVAFVFSLLNAAAFVLDFMTSPWCCKNFPAR